MILINQYFLDTNVVIGLVYCLDIQNPKTDKLITDNSKLYYSYHVKKEIKDVFPRKSNEYKRFFALIYSFLRKKRDDSFVSLSSIILFIDKLPDIGKLKCNAMKFAFQRIWEYFGFGENQEVSVIKFQFRKFYYSFDMYSSDLLDDFYSNATYSSGFKNKDSSVLNRILNKNLRVFFHDEDESILFDLHEYHKNHQDLDLTFVSCDEDFIKAVKELIDLLSFNNYIHLK